MAAAVLLAGAAVLTGCSSSGVIDTIPTAVGGLPDGVPQRPAAPPAYPSVHDMPPPRGQSNLSADEKKKLQDDLTKTRERAVRRGANPDETTSSTPAAGDAPNP
jgi:hypothetical protein